MLNTKSRALRSISQLPLVLFLWCGLQTGTEGSSVRVKMWKDLGTSVWDWGGGFVETYQALEITSGVMDAKGFVTVRNTSVDSRAILMGPTASPTLEFLEAAEGKWFIEDYWATIGPAPPLGYNLPRGLYVISSHQHIYSNWRYDVVGPVVPGSLRFQFEPQDITVDLGGSGSLEAHVLAPVGELFAQWFRLDSAGVVEPVGTRERMISDTTRHFFAPSVNHTAGYLKTIYSSEYFVEITDGKKIIRSKPVRVMLRVSGDLDIIDLTEENTTIRGRVWRDDNHNDIDDLEPGIAGLEVTLVDRDENNRIVARATTAGSGVYEFRGVPPKEPTATGYVVKWQVPEQYHVARPYIGGNPVVDCDAANASSLIQSPTSGPLPADSGPLIPGPGETLSDIDLGLFPMPQLWFGSSKSFAIETDSDQIIEIPFKLTKPVRYSPLTIHFRTWSQPKDGATRLIDYRQEQVSTTSVPVGSVDGTLRFTIIGDNVEESIETFFIELERVANIDVIDTTGKLKVHQVTILDDDTASTDPTDPDDSFKEYSTTDGNLIRTSGIGNVFVEPPPSLFWNESPELSTNGKSSYSLGPITNFGAVSAFGAPYAKGPRTISFEWKISGSSSDHFSLIISDPAINHDASNPPPIHSSLSGTTEWQPITASVPENHTINIGAAKLSLTSTPLYAWVRNLDLGGPDNSGGSIPDGVIEASPQPESLNLEGVAEAQLPVPASERALGVPSRAAAGVYNAVVETVPNTSSTVATISKLSVTAEGAISGSVKMDGKANRISGRFNSGGKFNTSLTAKDGSRRELFLQMQVDVTGGNTEIQGSLEGSDGTQGTIIAQKVVKWIKVIDPCPYQGRYSLILPQRAGGAPHAPTADGFASILIDAVGKVTIAGVLGDGTSFTNSSTITPNGRILLQTLLYGGKGSLSGTLYIRDVPTVSDLDGKLRWVKPIDPKAKLHQEGLDVEISAVGSNYNPALRPPLPNLEGGSPWPLTVTLSGGDFLTAPTSYAVLFTEKGSSALLAEVLAPDQKTPLQFLRGKLSFKTGIITFTYEDKSLKKKLKCRGVIYQKQNILTGITSGGATPGSFALRDNSNTE